MNNLPQELLNKIQIFLRHPCAEMLEKEIQWHISIANDNWKRAILEEYRESHSRTKFTRMFDEVMVEFEDEKEYIRSRDYHKRYFDYERLLRCMRSLKGDIHIDC